MIERDRLRELLNYSSETGEFRWAIQRGGYARSGALAGRLDSKGYRQISVDGRRYGAHRLAWVYMHGEWPPDEIDHINGDRDDNKFSNLRAVNRTLNMRNKRRYCTASSPHVGVQRRDNAWHVHIGNKYVGSFNAIDDAIEVRRAEEAKHGYHANHGRA